MSDDHNTSGIGENPEGDIRPDFLQGTQPSSSVKYDAHTSVSVWTTLGEVCGAHLRRQFRHDRNNDTWYEWLVGASGSGKSATASLIQATFGGMAMGDSAHLLLRNPQPEIDAEMAQLLQVDPFVLCVSEVERVGMSRLLSLTGGDAFGARRPHGLMQYGSLSGMIVATSVEAPPMDIDSGIPRRIAIIAFPAKLEESVNPNRFFSQDELDALITLSIHAAVHVGQRGWVPPQGNVEAKKRFLAEADPVTAWLQELPDSWHGKPFQQVLASYNREMPEPTTGTMLGKRISTSARWTRVKPKKTRLVHLVLVGRRL